MKVSEEVAKGLLNVQAVQINTNEYFTWTSGLKSPIYCDNRLTMSYPTLRQKITNAFVEKVNQMDVKPDVIAGCATAGIPHAAWLADALQLPMIYVRSAPKGHGKGNQIEGYIEKGQNVIVIEDLISTGGSAIEVATVLQHANTIVVGVLGIFTYGLKKAEQNFQNANIPYDTITTFDELMKVLRDHNKLDEVESQKLLEWRRSLDN